MHMNIFRRDPKYLIKEIDKLKDLVPEEFEDNEDLKKLKEKLKKTKPLCILGIDDQANRIVRQKVYERKELFSAFNSFYR